MTSPLGDPFIEKYPFGQVSSLLLGRHPPPPPPPPPPPSAKPLQTESWIFFLAFPFPFLSFLFVTDFFSFPPPIILLPRYNFRCLRVLVVVLFFDVPHEKAFSPLRLALFIILSSVRDYREFPQVERKRVVCAPISSFPPFTQHQYQASPQPPCESLLFDSKAGSSGQLTRLPFLPDFFSLCFDPGPLFE